MGTRACRLNGLHAVGLSWVAVGLLACGTPVVERSETGTAHATETARTQAGPVDGLQEFHYPDGRIRMHGPLVNGQRHGSWTAYFPDGKIQSRGQYHNGSRQGVAEVFYPDGTPYYTGAYHQDRPFGEWAFYDSVGTLARSVVYDSLGNMIESR